MPTYPVKNNKTGEEKELNLTIAQYEQWRKIILIGIRIGVKDVHPLRKLEIGIISWSLEILDGMMSLVKQQKHLVQE